MKFESHKRPGDPLYLFLFTQRRSYTLRLGRKRHPLFTERHQGTRGIPVTWHYLLGGRISFKRRKF